MRNFSILLACICMSVAAFGQATIFNLAGGGTLPTNWVGTDNITTNPIDKSSYYLVEVGNPGDIIESDIYDLSTYSSATFTINVATFGSGANNPAKIEISDDGGTSYSQVTTTNTPTNSSTYISGGSIILNSLTNQVKIRISNNGSSGRGVRLQNIKLEAITSAPTITFNSATSNETETNASFATSIPVTMSNYGSSQVDVSVSVTGGTAENSDYTLNTSSLSFTTNGTQNISININPDTDYDGETLELTVVETTATGVTITTNIHTITITDDEIQGSYTFGTISANTTEAGGTATFTVVLDVQPISDVVLNVSSGNTAENTVSPAILTFTSANYNVPQTVTVTGVDDATVDGNQTTTITVAVDDANSADAYDGLLETINVINEDDECNISNVVASASCNGNDAAITVSWTAANPGGAIEVDVNNNGYVTMSSGAIYTITGPTTAATGVTVTVRAVNETTCLGTTTVDIPSCPLVVPNVLFTEIADPSDNGNARFIEITNRGVSDVDVSGWKVLVYINGNSTAGGTYIFPSNTILTANGGGWVIATNATNFFSAYGFNANAAYGNFNGNGDDCFVLKDNNEVLMDIYGVIGVDGTGETWDYLDAIVTRNAGVILPNTAWTSTEWTITSGGVAMSNPLPVELLHFTAKPIDEMVVLSWATATEENNAYFNIQRSADGKNFETIATKAGAGTTYEVQAYSFIDEKPVNGLNYYRLQQVDFDGKFENHVIAAVLINEEQNEVAIIPTQVRNQFDIVFSETIDETIEINIYNLNGQIIQTKIITVQDNRQTVNVEELQAGLYILRLNINNTIVTKRFIKL